MATTSSADKPAQDVDNASYEPVVLAAVAAPGPDGAEEAVDDTVAEEQCASAPKPRWFTPLRLLIIFCIANVFVYLDRGEMALDGRGCGAYGERKKSPRWTSTAAKTRAATQARCARTSPRRLHRLQWQNPHSTQPTPFFAPYPNRRDRQQRRQRLAEDSRQPQRQRHPGALGLGRGRGRLSILGFVLRTAMPSAWRLGCGAVSIAEKNTDSTTLPPSAIHHPPSPQQGDFNLSNAEDGLLASGFLIGLLVACPVFSEACKHFSAFRLMGIGMGVWALSVLGCGLSFNWGSLFACRVLVGVGEASFIALATPFIDDYAPKHLKARWFAIFYMCTPAGYAAGYVFGGVVAGALGWRAAFYIVAAAMVPFIALMFFSRPLHLHGTRDTGPGEPGGRGGRVCAACVLWI